MSLELRGLVRLLPQDPAIFGVHRDNDALACSGIPAEQEDPLPGDGHRTMSNPRKINLPDEIISLPTRRNVCTCHHPLTILAPETRPLRFDSP